MEEIKHGRFAVSVDQNTGTLKLANEYTQIFIYSVNEVYGKILTLLDDTAALGFYDEDIPELNTDLMEESELSKLRSYIDFADLIY